MSILANLIDATRDTIPAYDPAAVDKAVATIPEPVLLSGPVHPDGFVHGLALTMVDAACVGGAALAVAGVAAVLALRTRGTKSEWSIRAGVAFALLFTACVALGGEAFIASGSEPLKGFVVTESRIILLDGKGGRTDVPGTSVAAVTRGTDGKVTFEGPGGKRILALSPGMRGNAGLDGAYDRFTAAFVRTAALRDAAGH